MVEPHKTGGEQKRPLRPRLGRRPWLVLVLFLVLAPSLVLTLQKPRSFYWSGRKFSLSLQTLNPGGAFAESGLWVRGGWDGPTGEFTHGRVYGLKLGKRLLRL